MGKLILLGAAVALADPVLLFVIFDQWGVEALLATVFLPPVIGSRLVAWSKMRSQRNAVSDMGAGMGDQVLLTAAGFMFVYPGPISTILACVLLIPFARKLIQAWAMKRIMKAVAGGNLTVVPIGGGFGSMNSVDEFQSQQPGGPLKRAEGTVIDDQNQPRLDAPRSPDDKSDPRP